MPLISTTHTVIAFLEDQIDGSIIAKLETTYHILGLPVWTAHVNFFTTPSYHDWWSYMLRRTATRAERAVLSTYAQEYAT